MSINRWIDKQNVVYTYNGILCGPKKEMRLVTCYNIYKPQGHYAKWKVSPKRTNTVWVHSYEIVKITETGGRKVVSKGWGKAKGELVVQWVSVQFSTATQLCLTLCNPMDCSTRGLPVHHPLPEFTQTHVHWVSNAISPSVIPFSSHLQSFPASGSFPMSQLFTSGGQSIGVSASASLLPMYIQDWFSLGGTGWISLLSKGL